MERTGIWRAAAWIVEEASRRRSSREADLVLRVSGVLALAGIAGSALDARIAALTPFVLFTVWTNGPYSPALPGAYEPVLMLYGALFPPMLIGALGTGGTVLIEWVNYHIYARASRFSALRPFTHSRWIAPLTRAFQRSPFLAIVACSMTPLPYWAARFLSATTRYPIGRHLAATAVGRFPKLSLIAALGTVVQIPPQWFVAGLSLVLAMLAVGSLIKRTGLRAGRVAAGPDAATVTARVVTQP